MKYSVVIAHKGQLGYCIVATDTQKVHSSWNKSTLAAQVAKDLNKQEARKARRIEHQRRKLYAV